MTDAPGLRADIMAYVTGRLCRGCGHEKVHHFGATDGKVPPLDERRCWVYEEKKRPPHGCRCTGWKEPAYTGPERRVKDDPLIPQWEERRGN